MAIKFTCFSQRGTGKAHNEDAVLLDGQVLLDNDERSQIQYLWFL